MGESSANLKTAMGRQIGWRQRMQSEHAEPQPGL